MLLPIFYVKDMVWRCNTNLTKASPCQERGTVEDGGKVVSFAEILCDTERTHQFRHPINHNLFFIYIYQRNAGRGDFCLKFVAFFRFIIIKGKRGVFLLYIPRRQNRIKADRGRAYVEITGYHRVRIMFFILII